MLFPLPGERIKGEGGCNISFHKNVEEAFLFCAKLLIPLSMVETFPQT
jgi:hypothetical protein